MEAFSDGVFAIAITLLVLEIAIPPGFEGHLLRGVLSQWPSYLAYIVSFATIGAIWLGHNTITHYMHSANTTFLRLNLALLLLVSFLPFPTKLLAKTSDRVKTRRWLPPFTALRCWGRWCCCRCCGCRPCARTSYIPIPAMRRSSC